MAWVIADDLTGDIAQADVAPLRILHGDREVLALEHVEQRADDEVLYADLGGWLVRHRPDGSYIGDEPVDPDAFASLRAKVADNEARVEALRRAKPSIGLAEGEPETAALMRRPSEVTLDASTLDPHGKHRDCCMPDQPPESADDEPGAGASAQASEQEPGGESAGDEPEVCAEAAPNGSEQPGEGEHPAVVVPPRDSDVRAWAHTYGLPCSAHGALKAWLREAYVRVDGGEPDHEAHVAASKAKPKATATTHAPKAPEPPAGASYVAAERARAAARSEQATTGAVEPAGDGTWPRPEQLDEVDRLLDQGYGPAHVAGQTGVDLAEVRRIDRERKGRA